MRSQLGGSLIDGPPINDFDLGYIMGLVVGEGCFSGDHAQPSLCIRLHAADPAPLRVCHRLLGGRLNGPYWYNGRHSRVWMLRGHDLRVAVPLFRAHLPESKKRVQFLAWCERWHLPTD